MTPDELLLISGVISSVVFLAFLHQLYWQVRAGLDDRQKWSAFFFILVTALIVGQLALSYLRVFTFGNTNRGPVFLFLWMGSVIWWSWCTARHNAAILRRIKDAKRLRKPLE